MFEKIKDKIKQDDAQNFQKLKSALAMNASEFEARWAAD